MITIKHLFKSFKQGKVDFKVLDDLDMTIKEGKMTAIMGRSGAGKTTLLNILCGLCRMDSGEYYFQGKPIDLSTSSKADKFRNQNFGIITQQPSLLNDYTVYENIALPLEYQKIAKKDIEKIVTETAQELSIDEKLEQYPDELSGGQLQRVSIARALCQNPSIILADEPTGSLDSAAEIEIVELFKKLNGLGKTIVIITHSSFIASYCDEVITIKDGKAFT